MLGENIPYTHMTKDEAVELLSRIAEGIARFVGPNCETIVHELWDDGIRALAVYNGHVSNREVGSTRSVFGIDTTFGSSGLPQTVFADDNCQEVRLPDGRRLKESTWLVRGEGYILSLDVTLDVTEVDRAVQLLQALQAVTGNLHETIYPEGLTLRDESDLMEFCISELGKPAEALNRAERLSLVRTLRSRGFFGYQRSVPALAARLGVSKSTVYNYLNVIQDEEDEGETRAGASAH